jgi:hypothetical protein
MGMLSFPQVSKAVKRLTPTSITGTMAKQNQGFHINLYKGNSKVL